MISRLPAASRNTRLASGNRPHVAAPAARTNTPFQVVPPSALERRNARSVLRAPADAVGPATAETDAGGRRPGTARHWPRPAGTARRSGRRERTVKKPPARAVAAADAGAGKFACSPVWHVVPPGVVLPHVARCALCRRALFRCLHLGGAAFGAARPPDGRPRAACCVRA